jgi:hypothetical protein
MTPDDARALHQSTQQLRTHWSGVITTHIGYAIVINVAIWSYFLKTYVDSLAAPSGGQPLYIGIASALSSILLALWRLYSRYIDNAIAGLYPDFLLCEGILSVPAEHQTSGYLIRAVPNASPILLDNVLQPKQKVEGIRNLVLSKRIGRRGHLWFDLSVLIVISVMFGASLFVLRSDLRSFSAIACFIGIGIGGLCTTLFEFFYYQREPTKEFVQKVLGGLKSGGTGV